MNVRKSTIVWSAVLIILICNVNVDASKASRRGSNKKTPNYDHVHLSYGGGSHGSKNTHQQHHHQPVQQHHHTQQQYAPSAPALNTANNSHGHRPAGWAVPAHNTPEQSRTVSNTQSALPYPANPQHPPPYTPNAQGHQPAGPPPPYSANPAYNPHVQSGPPPPYSANANNGFYPAGQQPPAYQPNAGGGYPNHGADGHYPQQPYNGHPGGSYPQPQGQPIINNYYGGHPGQGAVPVVQQPSGGSGGSFLQTALAAGTGSVVGSVAGNALYDALKPSGDSAPAPAAPAAAPAAPAAAPAAPAPAAPVESAPVAPYAAPVPVAPVAGGETAVPPASGTQPAGQPIPPQTDVGNGFAPNVPLAPLPDQSTNQSYLQSGVPLAPMVDATTIVANSNQTTPETTSVAPNQTTTLSAGVPLAPFPDGLKSAGATTFAIFNVSVYTIVSIIIASVF